MPSRTVGTESGSPTVNCELDAATWPARSATEYQTMYQDPTESGRRGVRVTSRPASSSVTAQSRGAPFGACSVTESVVTVSGLRRLLTRKRTTAEGGTG